MLTSTETEAIKVTRAIGTASVGHATIAHCPAPIGRESIERSMKVKALHCKRGKAKEYPVNGNIYRRYHNGVTYKGYALTIDPMAEDSVLERIEKLPGKKLISYPRFHNGKTHIEYWKAIDNWRRDHLPDEFQ